MKKKFFKSGYSGSITVEAAFVMPIVIFTVFAIIYLTFSLHDNCRLQGSVDKILHKSLLYVKHDAAIDTGRYDYKKIGDRGVLYMIFGDSKEEKTEIENVLQRELHKGLFLTEITSIKVEANQYQITIAVNANKKISLPFFNKLFRKLSSIHITAYGAVHDPAEAVRAAEIILDTGSGIKGMDKLKEELDRILGSLG